MCGIAGQVGGDIRRLLPVFEDMRRSLERRGPDQRGMAVFDEAALIHARLSVMDPENGRQPMSFDGYTIVYNGEIYNAPELRRELCALGHEFTNRSDTEVLLHAFAQFGEDAVDRLNGIYAFAVWDSRKRRLFLCRDRMGVKPLFYARRRGALIFASELKALLRHPWVEPEVDRQGLAEVLLLGPGTAPGSGVFRDISELLPGECGWYSPDTDTLSLRRYWRLRDAPHTDSFEETAEKVRFLVLDAIKRQLVSDVPLCTFLSGGLDSSIISAVADREYAESGMALDTVSVDYLDNAKYFKASKFQPNSDPAFIKIMADFLRGNNHQVTLDTPELVSALYEAVEARDLPGMADVDSSLLLFCREIKKLATVAVSGECADEIFGGYPWYRDPTVREREGFPWAQSTAYRASFIKDGVLGGIDPAQFVDGYYRAACEGSDILPGTPPLERRMKQMMNLNVDWFMQTLLARKDRMSMWSSLEVRVPFCDHRIAEYLYTVPWEFKDRGGYEKGLLREAMRGILPDEVLWRKKSPYPKTHNPAYLAAVNRELEAVLADKSQPLHDIAREDKLRALMTSDRPVPWYGQLMTTPQTVAWFLQLNYWLKNYKVRII